VSQRKRGRPAAGAEPLDDDALLAAGLALLDEGGAGAVTIRGVARRLGVTPMAVSHRTGGLDGLLARVLAAAHEGFRPPESRAAGPDDVAAAVLAYAEAATRHPHAVAALFGRPDLMPPTLAEFTEWLRLRIAEGDPEGADRGVALLIDYAHGYLLAASQAEPDGGRRDFEANLRRLSRWILGG
jgi:AcrR family transcriptional regulator